MIDKFLGAHNLSLPDKLFQAFDVIQQPRTDFELKHFVINQHDTEPQRYAQCVIELHLKYDAIRRALLEKKKAEMEILELKKKKMDAVSEVEIEIKKLDSENLDYAILGALREFQYLLGLWHSFDKQYTREELNVAQEEYWDKRLTRQANLDLLATGRISQSNADAFRMIGKSPTLELDHVREVEKRYLEIGDTKALIAVPTEKKAEKGLPNVEGITIPSGMQVKYFNVWGRKVADAYNEAVRECLKDGADFLFTVEDDTFPPSDALIRLLEHIRSGREIIGAWYPKRNGSKEGTPIVVKDGRRQPLDVDGLLHEVYTIPMGCTLFNTNIFLKVTQPWFFSTDHLTQDSFFSQKARDVGIKLWCDTSIRCQHIDRNTGEVYE